MVDSLPTVAGYELRRVIGSGGSATIHEALDIRHARSVAVKIITTERLDESRRRKFVRELRALGRLSDHPHVVTVHDSGFTLDGRPFLVMPFMDRGTFRDLVRDNGPMPAAEVVVLGVLIGSTLETAHRRGVLHCDIKPSNLLMGPYDTPMLADFGISSVVNAGVTTTHSASLTLLYAAPEIIDDGEPTVRSDIYSLGASLYALAEGRAAYSAKGTAAIMRNIFSATEPPPLTAPGSKELSDVLRCLMAIDPEERPSSAFAAVELFQGVQRRSGVPVTEAVLGDPADRPEGLDSFDFDGDLDDALAELVLPPDVHKRDVLAGAMAESRNGRLLAATAVLAAIAVVAALVAVFALRDGTDQQAQPVAQQPALQATAQSTPVATLAPRSGEGAIDEVVTAEPTAAPTAHPSAPAPPPDPDAVAPDVVDASTLALVVNPPPGRPAPTGLAHGDVASTVDWSRNGLIATGGFDNTVRIWDATGRHLADLDHEGDIFALAWSPDGASLAVGDRERLGIWDLTTGEFRSFEHSESQGSLAWSIDGTRLVSGSWQRIQIWDPIVGVRMFEASHEFGSTTAVAMADDSIHVVAATSSGPVLEWETTALRHPTVVGSHDGDGYDATVTYLSDGSVLSGGTDGRIQFWGADAQPERTLVDEWHPVILAVSPDEASLLSAGQTSTARLFDLTSGKRIMSFVSGDQPIADMAWEPDGQRVLVVSHDGSGRIWDLSDPDNLTAVELTGTL